MGRLPKSADANAAGPIATPEQRAAAWRSAIRNKTIPPFVRARLAAARAGRLPWIATLTPVELLAVRGRGVRPIATVSGTYWAPPGRDWAASHARGWARAQDLIRREAVAAGANAVVDVRMRSCRLGPGGGTDFTLVGTAIRLQGLPPTKEPPIATVSALEFLRLRAIGFTPMGVAVGAKDGSIDGSHLARPNLDIGGWRLTALQAFWERLRRRALVDLRKAAGAIGDGVLAHVQISELEREGPAGLSNRFFGQQMMVGTVVRASGGDADLGAVRMVVDMRDGLSPLTGRRPGRHDAFDQLGEQELAL